MLFFCCCQMIPLHSGRSKKECGLKTSMIKIRMASWIERSSSAGLHLIATVQQERRWDSAALMCAWNNKYRLTQDSWVLTHEQMVYLHRYYKMCIVTDFFFLFFSHVTKRHFTSSRKWTTTLTGRSQRLKFWKIKKHSWTVKSQTMAGSCMYHTMNYSHSVCTSLLYSFLTCFCEDMVNFLCCALTLVV